jgi:hypothetical protein
MVFSQALGKSGLKPAFSRKSKVAVLKLKFWNSLIDIIEIHSRKIN